jgi:hypothetical protein
MDRLDKSTLDSFHLVTQNRTDGKVARSKSEDEQEDAAVKSILHAAQGGNNKFRLIIRSNGCDPSNQRMAATTSQHLL